MDRYIDRQHREKTAVLHYLPLPGEDYPCVNGNWREEKLKLGPFLCSESVSLSRVPLVFRGVKAR